MAHVIPHRSVKVSQHNARTRRAVLDNAGRSVPPNTEPVPPPVDEVPPAHSLTSILDSVPLPVFIGASGLALLVGLQKDELFNKYTMLAVAGGFLVYHKTNKPTSRPR